MLRRRSRAPWRATVESGRRYGRRRWRRIGGGQLGLVCAGEFAVWLGSGAIFPYLPIFLREQADASVALIGVIAAAYFAGVVLFSSPLGALSDRVGRKRMIVAGTLLYALATVLFLTTTEPLWFIVFRLLEGMGAAAVVPAGQALVAEITPAERRSRAFGWLTTAQFGGLIIGPAVAWPLAAIGGGDGLWAFYAIFIFGAALTALTAAALIAFLREPERASRSVEARPRLPLRRLMSRPIVAIIVVVAAAEFAVGGWEVVWSLWLRDLGASLTFVGLTWIVFSAPLLFAFAGGMLADRTDRSALISAGFGVMGTSWIIVALAQDPGIALACMALAGTAFAVAYPAKQAFLVQITPLRSLATVQGIEQTAMQLSALVGALTAPLLYGAFGAGVFLVSGAVALGGVAVAAPTLRREWRHAREDEAAVRTENDFAAQDDFAA